MWNQTLRECRYLFTFTFSWRFYPKCLLAPPGENTHPHPVCFCAEHQAHVSSLVPPQKHAVTTAREDSVAHKYKQDLRRFLIGCYGNTAAPAIHLSEVQTGNNLAQWMHTHIHTFIVQPLHVYVCVCVYYLIIYFTNLWKQIEHWSLHEENKRFSERQSWTGGKKTNECESVGN